LVRRIARLVGILTELRKGITYKILHSELKPEIGYYSFWRFFRNIFSSKKQNICMRLTHKPGEKAFVDFCDGIDIINDLTGEIIKTPSQPRFYTLRFNSLGSIEFSMSF
jgi:hypothetical protein